jgi:hypothetical protein
VNLVAEIDARGEDAAKFDSVRFHTHYNDRVFINVKKISVLDDQQRHQKHNSQDLPTQRLGY